MCFLKGALDPFKHGSSAPWHWTHAGFYFADKVFKRKNPCHILTSNKEFRGGSNNPPPTAYTGFQVPQQG